MMKNHLIPMAALSILGMTNVAQAARNDDRCASEPPAHCYPAGDCKHCYCLGPDNYGANAPVCPRTCNGDLVIEVAGFYWNSHQDGMQYAVLDKVKVDPGSNGDLEATLKLNNLIDAKFENPNFKWDFGFKLGLGYCTTCDGWDINVLWTWYQGKAHSHVEAETEDNTSLITLWSGFASTLGGITYATDIETRWKLKLNLVDLELGRQYWVSKYLTMRPHVGIRISWLYQDYNIQHKGGSWAVGIPTGESCLSNLVKIDNDFRGAGLRGGLNTLWHLGCGWSLYADFALSIVYGRFTIEHDETNRETSGQHLKSKIIDTTNRFRVSRAMTDLALGGQWATMFCDCKYGFAVSLGWEHHLFFDQNQMWRVVRLVDDASSGGALPNNQGTNSFNERRGDLDTQGWTLTVKFDF